MARQKISAKAVAADIRSGMSQAEMMERYSLSARGLEYLFQKLIEHQVVTTAEIATCQQRILIPDQSEKQQTASEPPLPLTDSEIDPELAKAVVEDVRKGRHDYDLMVRYRLGRDELQNLLERLVRLGHLSAEEVEARKPRKTKQCPHCRGQVFEDAGQCQHCGRALVQPTPSASPIRPGIKGGGIASKNVSSDEGCAWEDYWKNRGSRGLFKAYFHTVLQCLRSPTHFFSNLPTDFGYWAPTLLGAVSAAVPAAFTMIWLQLLTLSASELGPDELICLAVSTFLVALVCASIVSFVSSLFLHGALMLFRGVHMGFQATFRAISYSCVTSLFGVIPVIGLVAGNLWGLFLSGIGLRETHGTSTGKAFGAVSIPICIVAVGWVMFGLEYNPLIAGKQSSPAVKPTISTTYTGTEFRTDVGQFSVITPSPLMGKKKAANTVLGKIDVSLFSVKQGNIEYTIAYADSLPSYFRYFEYLPQSLFFRTYPPGKALDKYGDSIAKKVHGKLVSETKITLDNYPGREAVIEDMEKVGHDVVVKARAYMVRTRTYQVIVVAPTEELGTPEVNTFFESFTLLAE